ncbi:MAG: iron-sulfur cluster assembly accessory protein [Idiomarina sp.]|nr:iron-sulfur cluster assembly accessory protein [Idiomarina sp.]
MSVETFVPSTNVLSVTPSAVRHFETKLAKQPGKIIRLSTKESGCTGFAYVVDYADAPQADDVVMQLSDVLTVAVADSAIPVIRNTELDYVKEGVNGILKFNNPNVIDECGCGESFSVR